MTRTEYTKELDEADAEIEAGNFVLHEDVLKYFEEISKVTPSQTTATAKTQTTK